MESRIVYFEKPGRENTDAVMEVVKKRAEELVEDHARLRAASGSASRVSVEAVLPPDVIGMFVLMPGEI